MSPKKPFKNLKNNNFSKSFLKKEYSKIFIALLLALIIFSFFGNTQSQSLLANILGLENDWSFENNASDNNKILGSNDKVEYATVKRVVDGDTVVLDNGNTVRYLNIDTPETKKPGTPVKCYGPEASSMNKSLVEGREVVLVADQELTDRYGRDLRFIFLKGQDFGNIENSVNAVLVKTGYARTSIYKPNDTFEDDFYSFEREAKDKNLGIWKACSNPFEE
jgi:micrococcal nuclease